MPTELIKCGKCSEIQELICGNCGTAKLWLSKEDYEKRAEEFRGKMIYQLKLIIKDMDFQKLQTQENIDKEDLPYLALQIWNKGRREVFEEFDNHFKMWEELHFSIYEKFKQEMLENDNNK